MATFKYQGIDIYYEVYGEGFPLLILNGIMMSCKSWENLIEPMTKHRQLILLDMVDQGQSGTGPEKYNHDIQVETVNALFKHLNLAKADIFGISYGGEIAIQVAIKYPELVDHLLLFNTSSWTSPWLEEIGHAWNFASHNWESYYATTIPVIYSPQFYTEEIEWIKERKKALKPIFSNKDFIERMIRLTNSSIGYDVRDQIDKIENKTLIVSSEYDFVTPKHEQEYLHSKIKNSNYVIIPNKGHASMYEASDLFLTLLIGFIYT